jgi:hypothetical protein
MTEMREDMNTDFDSDYKIGIVSEWSLNPKVTDKFLEEIWKASTEILPHLEVQVVIDDNNKLFISSGSPSYVDFQINPVGMKLPIKCWIHTHPFGMAYWSGIDWRTIDTWRPMMKKAIVLGNDQRGIWYNTLKGRNWIWESGEVQKMKSGPAYEKIDCAECVDNERLLEILLDMDYLDYEDLQKAKHYAELEGLNE